MKAQFKDAYDKPIWIMYECERGNRFTAVKGGMCEEKDLSTCYLSGCTEDHGTKIMGETSDRTIAHEWFRRV